MHDFQYRGNELFCEEVPVRGIAEIVGTPLYLYSLNTLENHFRAFQNAFSGIDHLICFSVKANSNISILRIFIRMEGGVDVVSGGELFRSMKAGASPNKIVYSGVGKREDEIEYALELPILMFNIESTQELVLIDRIAGRMKTKAPIALRVNPDVDPKTHPYISTGLKKNKFGINIQKSLDDYRLAHTLPNVKVIGVSCHIGSQLTEVGPFVEAMQRIRELVLGLRAEGMPVQYIDIGGGLGITYHQEEPPHPRDYARALMEELKEIDCTLILEPGRVIVGNAGILVTRVLYTKEGEEKNFIVVDGAMNDLIRPSLYGSYQRIQPVRRSDRPEWTADVVGPICESSDFLARDRKLSKAEQGDLLAVMSAGAYGFSMSSNYNSRPRVAEVLVAKDKFFVIRQREDYDDLIRGEVIPDFLKE
ncbi:MAG: diaminopimelate decarboxylase [Deltaproteobacteria bacterium SM23_61]|nr:MAG: diaminopimelate decarboxylase [Deltaproteobacteria bacterium SM23_61]